MKQLIENIDFLWKGNTSSLVVMWGAILMALIAVSSLFFIN
jgi:hypothetical protein